MGDGVRRALIVGVDEYADNDIDDLTGAVNDATEMRRRLTEDGDFKVEDDYFLVNDEATADNVRGALSDLLWRTDEIDTALIYFSGHGFEDEYGNGYLAPSDMVKARPIVRGVKMQELRDLMRTAINKNVVLLILDSCFSGIAAGDKGGTAPVAGAVKATFDAMTEDQLDATAKGRLVLASSGADQKSREKADCEHELDPNQPPHAHGVFTYQVLEGLYGLAATQGEDITLEGLRTFVQKKLRSKKQTPTWSGAGMQNSDQIRLVRATTFQEINANLGHAEAALESGVPAHAILAFEQLVPAYRKAPGTVVKLQKEIDKSLKAMQGPLSNYLRPQRGKLRIQCPTVSPLLDALVRELSFERLEQEDADMIGFLITLEEARLSADPGAAFKGFLSEMSSYERSRGQSVDSNLGES